MSESRNAILARLRAAGAVIVAKTNMDQFASGLVGTRSPYGTPPNTLDPSLGFGNAAGDRVDASKLGLVALSGSTLGAAALGSLVTQRTERRNDQPVSYKLHELTFDGKAFHVTIIDGHVG